MRFCSRAEPVLSNPPLGRLGRDIVQSEATAVRAEYAAAAETAAEDIRAEGMAKREHRCPLDVVAAVAVVAAADNDASCIPDDSLRTAMAASRRNTVAVVARVALRAAAEVVVVVAVGRFPSFSGRSLDCGALGRL